MGPSRLLLPPKDWVQNHLINDEMVRPVSFRADPLKESESGGTNEPAENTLEARRQFYAAISMVRFMDTVNRRFNLALNDYNQLWQWSVEHIARHWTHRLSQADPCLSYPLHGNRRGRPVRHLRP